MSKNNYSQYYKKNAAATEGKREGGYTPKRPRVDVEAPEVKMEAAPMPVFEEVTKSAPMPAVDVIIEPKPTTGIVTGCSKLNVRSDSDTTADILCILDVNSEVMIDLGKSNREWFKVTTASGVDGYCMRKFIKI